MEFKGIILWGVSDGICNTTIITIKDTTNDSVVVHGIKAPSGHGRVQSHLKSVAILWATLLIV